MAWRCSIARAVLQRPGNQDIQLDFLLNYASNIALYPVFQKYFREVNPPLLAIWGRNDPFFKPSGAEAFLNDNPNAEVVLLNTGHFALEEEGDRIGALMHEFLDRTLRSDLPRQRMPSK